MAGTPISINSSKTTLRPKDLPEPDPPNTPMWGYWCMDL